MKLIALCGAAGAGKDTVADMLPARKLAFADTLYAEVAEAWGVTVEWLKDRKRKGGPQPELRVGYSKDKDFVAHFMGGRTTDPPLWVWRSPRQILQWWGDYRRAQDPDYFVNAARKEVLFHWAHESIVLTDVRFPNEAAMVRQLGGQIWQIRRPGYEAGGTGHASDTDGSEFAPDLVVTNGGSLEDLQATVLAAWEGV